MPIIAKIGRKKPETIILISVIYLVLCLGALTMIYPYLIMIASTFCSPADVSEYRLVPKYMYSDEALYRKFLPLRYSSSNPNTQTELYKAIYPESNPVFFRSFETGVNMPENMSKEDPAVKQRASDFIEFGPTLPKEFFGLANVGISVFYGPFGPGTDLWVDYLKSRYNSLRTVTDEFNYVYEYWVDIKHPYDRPDKPDWIKQDNPIQDAYEDFKVEVLKKKPRFIKIYPVEYNFHKYLSMKFKGDVENLNQEMGYSPGEGFAAFKEVRLTETAPAHPVLASVWEKYVKSGSHPVTYYDHEKLDLQTNITVSFFEALDDKSVSDLSLRVTERIWNRFVEKKYAGNEEEFKKTYLPDMKESVINQKVSALKEIYGDKANVFWLAKMPYRETEFMEFHRMKDKGGLRKFFVTGNYESMINFFFLNGRALFNTLILISIQIFIYLTVNPLAAFALSRYKLTYTNYLLLYLLATMAFPPVVTMIPRFLLIKKLGLLNTYGAVVFPYVANGYAIFLLKGFFDALPKELYEAAEIDGASKLNSFYNITFQLSKPIFAINMLNAFNVAYNGWMWAFVLCPDKELWTLMVHVYDYLQGTSGVAMLPLSMTVLVLASLPTLCVFLFAQNVILKGIILPSFKG
ncbi:MAG: carbohydrate ABC transporter permease [Fibrobacterota bacterium]